MRMVQVKRGMCVCMMRIHTAFGIALLEYVCVIISTSIQAEAPVTCPKDSITAIGHLEPLTQRVAETARQEYTA